MCRRGRALDLGAQLLDRHAPAQGSVGGFVATLRLVIGFWSEQGRFERLRLGDRGVQRATIADG
jgi:hypothetical protein